MNATTCQVNLIDKNGKPTETDAALSFYDQQTGALKYTFVHTMNNRGIPDTLRLEASGIYRVVAHTLPSVEVKDVKLIAGKHNIIPMDAPQGFLKVKTGENNLHRDIGFILRKKNESQTLVAATLKDQLKLIVGEYELEILTLPRTYVKNVTISQSHTTQVKIDEPGSVNFQLSSFGTASILIQKEKEWIWVTNLSDNQTQETLKLMPGAYKLVFRAKSAKETLFTTEKNFTVTAGESQIVSLK
jgi:Ca-activated chloride channel family protein